MVIHARFAVGFLTSLLFLSSAYSQQGGVQSVQPEDKRIYLDVVVTQNGGAPVAGLGQQDFTVLDNKVKQPITSFRALGGSQSAEPINVILVIDAVNTSYSVVAYERGQIDKFLKANGGKLSRPTALAVFTDQGIKMQKEFSTDGNALSASLADFVVALRTVNRSAGFYGAVERLQLSVNGLRSLAASENSRPGRTLIFWVSPGWPFLSGPGVQLDPKQEQQLFNNIVDISAQLRQSRVTLYSIDPRGTQENTSFTFYYENFVKGVRKPSQAQAGNLGLQVLATQSGGLALHSSNDISSLLEKCMADTDAYYELSFDPLQGEHDEYHQIEVQLSKRGLTARTRQGYYSQP